VPVKLNFTNPITRPAIVSATLEWVHVDFLNKTLRGYVSLADADGNLLKSQEIDTELTDNQLNNFGTTVLNKLINQGVLPAGTIVTV
jgi:hypothetical protein